MSGQAQYAPGPPRGAHVEKDGQRWTLVLVRELRHAPEMVWEALTDPAQLAEWAPFDPDRNIASEGPVRMKMAHSPRPVEFDTQVKRAEPPRLLEYSWGESDLRWELEPTDRGTRLTLWHNIDKGFVSWGAAGWHICFDVLEHLLSGDPIGRLVGNDAIRFGHWKELVAQYAKQFEAQP
ncbi:hypothetical protein Acid345_3465 [Candidatus Koribacter versatilis Ellin345]|uniref:Activator of Hsp90 ATPase homologue 1/2-like C-terminal domain-containing protein n=1 Tax=Koribacter versatilis (strain Ellin345) TaxID=204669 RepID=Q1IKY4_KORVE|nr:SRPBCC family protein [Candidatus Koribacter versatilis]ABF42466.1 hypothetical protein Acid345_3465 [Candidatus Koribacter versatilis Ellin345]